MKTLQNFIYESGNIVDINDIDEFKSWLRDNGYEFTEGINKHYDNADAIYLKCKRNDKITIIYSFIQPSEYLYDVEKNGEIIYSIQSSCHVGYRTTEESLKLDPLKYCMDSKKNCEKKLKSAKKGKINGRTGERKVDTMEVARLETKITKYDKWINKLK